MEQTECLKNAGGENERYSRDVLLSSHLLVISARNMCRVRTREGMTRECHKSENESETEKIKVIEQR